MRKFLGNCLAPIPAIVLGACCLGGWSTEAFAAGEWSVTAGWVHIDPHSTSGPLTVTRIGGTAADIPQLGSGVRVSSADTLLIAVERDLGRHLSAQFAVGLPPLHRQSGTGALQSAGVLGEGQQLSPSFLFKYNFGQPEQVLRPFVGLGFNYTWFRKSKITNDAFRQANYGPDSTTRVSVTTSWNPVANVGLNYRLTEHWFLNGEVAYAPLKSDVIVEAQNTLYGVPIQVTTRVKSRTIASSLNLGYRF